MRFVLLGAGQIAQLFLDRHKHEFGRALELEGIVAPSNVVAPFIRTDRALLFFTLLPLKVTDRQESVLKEFLLDLRPDFILSVQHPWILSSEILGLVGGRALNLHNARTPQYRGP